MDREIIKQIVAEQRETFEKEIKIVERPFPEKLFLTPKMVVIMGIRRCGKSTFLRQLSGHYPVYSYFNFEDERLLDFIHNDFNTLLEIFLEQQPGVKTFFFDEIQNISGWEKFARRLFTEGYKLFITGSNAKLLSSEIATSLTGRNIKLELYPFSFKEVLQYHAFPIKTVYTTKEKATISQYLEEYVQHGGFPEIVIRKDHEELNEIYQDILIKDIIVRFSIRDAKDFRELALYLLSNISKKISFNNLKNLLNFSNTSKIKRYVDFLSEAYLFFTVLKYDFAFKKQIKNDRKIYSIDPGLVNAISFKFSKERGRLLENIIFLELRRQKQDIYYHTGRGECDFVIKKETKITLAIQSADSLANQETREREIRGLVDAMAVFNLTEGIIITKNEEENIIIEGKNIRILPLWKFLLYGL